MREGGGGRGRGEQLRGEGGREGGREGAVEGGGGREGGGREGAELVGLKGLSEGDQPE